LANQELERPTGKLLKKRKATQLRVNSNACVKFLQSITKNRTKTAKKWLIIGYLSLARGLLMSTQIINRAGRLHEIHDGSAAHNQKTERQ